MALDLLFASAAGYFGFVIIPLFAGVFLMGAACSAYLGIKIMQLFRWAFGSGGGICGGSSWWALRKFSRMKDGMLGP